MSNTTSKKPDVEKNSNLPSPVSVIPSVAAPISVGAITAASTNIVNDASTIGTIETGTTHEFQILPVNNNSTNYIKKYGIYVLLLVLLIVCSYFGWIYIKKQRNKLSTESVSGNAHGNAHGNAIVPGINNKTKKIEDDSCSEDNNDDMNSNMLNKNIIVEEDEEKYIRKKKPMINHVVIDDKPVNAKHEPKHEPKPEPKPEPVNAKFDSKEDTESESEEEADYEINENNENNENNEI